MKERKKTTAIAAPRYHAILTRLSRKGYWHLSKTLSTKCGVGNDFTKAGAYFHANIVDWDSLSG